MNRKIIMWIMVMVLLTASVLAVGVSPVRKVIDFEPNKEYDLQLKIKNTGQTDIKAVMYARGALEEHITLIDSLVVVTSSEKEKVARYKVTLPASMKNPGTHKTDLVIMEYPISFGTETSTAQAQASVVSELWLKVPYPGKYAEGQLYIEPRDNVVDFAIGVMNYGKEEISTATAVIKILGPTNEEIGRVETSSVSIKPSEQGKLVGRWEADVNPGKYHAVAEISYDGKAFTLEKTFEVGKLYIDIKRIDVKDFTLGQVAIFDILLESTWNDQINDVYGEMTVTDKSGVELETFKTATTDIPALGQGLLKAYWDTNGVDVGTYDLKLLIHYAEKVTEKLIETEVNIDSIRTELGATAQVVASPGAGRDTILTVIVIILIAINIGWFVFLSRRGRRNDYIGIHIDNLYKLSK